MRPSLPRRSGSEATYLQAREQHNPMEPPRRRRAMAGRPADLVEQDAMGRQRAGRDRPPFRHRSWTSAGHQSVCRRRLRLGAADLAARHARRYGRTAGRLPRAAGVDAASTLNGDRLPSPDAAACRPRLGRRGTTDRDDPRSHGARLPPTRNFAEGTLAPAATTYACPNRRTRYGLVAMNVSTPCPMRGPGWATGLIGQEMAMDELAEALKLDPIELRLRNYAERDPTKDLPWSSKALRACYRQGAERFGWKEPFA